MYKSTKIEYKGPYIVTNDKRYYVGTTPFKMGAELIGIKIEKAKEDALNNRFYNTYNVKKYNILKKKIKNQLGKTRLIPSSKPLPKHDDYRKGYYYRYFVKRINGHNYLEVDSKTYNSLKDKEFIYDHHLYDIGNIKWFLRGKDVQLKNSTEIKIREKRFPNLLVLFPVLNEHILEEGTPIQENQYTEGGELYYSDGSEYIGDYHTHPLQGPMVGPVHIEKEHDKLYYFNQLPNFGDTSYEDFLTEYDKIICYKCINTSLEQGFSIVSYKASRLSGCEASGGFKTQSEAEDSCRKAEQ